MKTIQKTLILLFVSGSIARAQEGKFTMAFLNIDPDRPYLPENVVDSLQKLHRANMGVLAKEGKLLAAGPFD